MTSDESRQLVLDYLRAQGSGDTEKAAACLADDVEWRPPRGADLDGLVEGAFRGRKHVLSSMAEIGPRYFDLSTMKVDVRWIVAEGDKVVVRTRATAKATNGRDYENEYVWVYFCRDGRIAEIEEHVDSKRFHDIVIAD